ncbi:sulfatase [Flavobacterium faecale]|uniref:Sulfatase n=1 Tax=Flavobacterium faecale TaxID=1355330 RepID=A0A2S1LHP4_9FLAO|nr:sulfatase [Flavobacterium faecale]AWG23273.1 sulfatase [Flavobacterium faecale]
MINFKKTLTLAVVSLLTVSAIAQKEIKRPNIIWIMAEDMSLDLECYGMEAVKTPNLNKMAAEGIRYDNCFVTNPICSPSRSAMMVGTHQLKINAQHHRSNREVPLDSKFKPFTALLRDAGYTTILGNQSVMGLGRKTDVNFKSEQIGPWDGKTQFGLFDKYDTIVNDDKPFFAQIQLVASHRGDWWNEVRAKSKHPVDPAKVKLPSYLADDPAIRLDWAKYLDQIEFLDNEVGMIFKELEDKGLADNTIVIFIGDNGRCNIKGKGYLEDPGLHIPFIMHYPKNYAGPHVSKEIVSAVDITATILDLAGVKVPSFMTGKSILKKGFKNDYVYAARDLWDEILEKSRAITSDKWKYIRNDKPEIPYDAHQAYLEFYRPAIHVMRRLNEEGKLNEAQKLFFAPKKPVEELYNLEKDPEELHNLAMDTKYSSILTKLRKKTLRFDKKMKPVSDVYEPEIADAVQVLEWVKKEKPEQYQQMLDGVEIGFHKMGQEYKAANKKNKQTKKSDE